MRLEQGVMLAVDESFEALPYPARAFAYHRSIARDRFFVAAFGWAPDPSISVYHIQLDTNDDDHSRAPVRVPAC